MRRRIGQALAFYADQSGIGTGEIVKAEPFPMVVDKIALGGVTVQMGFRNMEVAAVDRAFEDREVVLDRIGVPEIGADVFLGRVIHRAMPRECLANPRIDQALVGHQVAGLIDVRSDDRLQARGGDVRSVDMEAADLPIALNQREDRGLWRHVVFPVACFAADVGLIGLDYLVLSAQRSTVGANTEIGHCLAHAMPEEPSGFQSTLKGALKLAGADPLFRGTEQIDSLEPYPHRDMAGLEHGSDLDGEWLAAGVTLAETDAVGLAPQPPDLLAGRSAVWTDGTVRPEPRFDVFVSGFFAMEMSGGKVALHGLSP